MEAKNPSTIDEYIQNFPKERQDVMYEVSKIIRKTEPEIKEKISWGMPTFYLGKNIIHFAQAKNHLGIYPGPEAIEYFAEEIKEFKSSKGAFQIPNKGAIPTKLIEDIVRYNVKKVNKL